MATDRSRSARDVVTFEYALRAYEAADRFLRSANCLSLEITDMELPLQPRAGVPIDEYFAECYVAWCEFSHVLDDDSSVPVFRSLERYVERMYPLGSQRIESGAYAAFTNLRLLSMLAHCYTFDFPGMHPLARPVKNFDREAAVARVLKKWKKLGLDRKNETLFKLRSDSFDFARIRPLFDRELELVLASLKSQPNGHSKPRRNRKGERLSDKQRRVYDTVQRCNGSFSAAARELDLDESTVREHHRIACEKLGNAREASPSRSVPAVSLPEDRRGQSYVEYEGGGEE